MYSVVLQVQGSAYTGNVTLPDLRICAFWDPGQFLNYSFAEEQLKTPLMYTYAAGTNCTEMCDFFALCAVGNSIGFRLTTSLNAN